MSALLDPVAGVPGQWAEDAVRPPRRPRPEPSDPSPVAASLRFAAFAALVLYGCQHWVRQVAPTPGPAAPQITAVAVATAALLLACARIERRHERRVAVVLLCLVATVVGLAAAGIPVRFLGWRNWGMTLDGIREGLSSLPNLNVPYRGLDDWVRWVILAGAALLALAAAIVGFAPARGKAGPRPVPTALLLTVLYALPVVERNPASPVLSGTGFAVLLALYLGAERIVAVRGARPRLLAAGGALLALLAAVLLAPQLDGGAPWLDYPGLAGGLGERTTTSFDWNHSYAPLQWPRDGRELLRVKAKDPAYWKAVGLQRFDGLRWVEQPSDDGSTEETAAAASHPEWSEQIDVTVRALRSEQYVTAGSATEVDPASVPPVPGAAGTYRTGTRPLRPGDTYSARVYAPRPTPAELRVAGTDYPQAVTGVDLSMELPQSVGGPKPGRPFPNGIRQTTIVFPPFDSQTRLVTLIPGVRNVVGGEGLLARSRYARTWALAQRLRLEASSPFDLVRRIRQRVQQGARYTEQPEAQAIPLDAFLFDAKEGYCQQFSGAMALLLRMAGVPARIGSGFTSGSFDSTRDEYIVRDLDAHSWVEAYFPGIGWVTFDPTPTVAPPAAQETGDGGDGPGASESAGSARARADVAKATPPPAPSAKGATRRGGGGGDAAWPAAIVLLLAGGMALVGWAWRGTRTNASPVLELERALARSGRPVAPGLTLQALERSFAGAPAAAAYLRKLRLSRYAGQAVGPTRRERAALRSELAAGGGALGWLRAWWALPPQRPHR